MGRFVDDQESRILVEKRSDMGSALLVGGRFDFRNSFFRLQNVQIGNGRTARASISGLSGMVYCG